MLENIVAEIINLVNSDKTTLDINVKIKNSAYIVLNKYEIKEKATEIQCVCNSWEKDLQKFIIRKHTDGLSEKTLKLYTLHLKRLLQYLNKPIKEITEDDLFVYLTQYKQVRKVSNVYLDNMRLVFSSFFTWQHNKGYIDRNPSSGLSKIKCEKKIKQSFNDEELEKIKRGCSNIRDLAIVECLYSTGVRVSELTNLNISDIDFVQKQAIVFGKGRKERTVYLSQTAMMYLKKYLENRSDNNNALFVSQKAPYNRLKKSGIESILKKIGKRANVENVHPHRFRRTFATNMLKKGMPIEEVKILLGHVKLDTTMLYCCINNESIKYTYNKYMSA